MACGLWPRLVRLTAASLALTWLAALPAAAASKHATHAKPHPAKKPPKGCPAPKEEPPVALVPVAGAKVALFEFTGDDAESVRRQVVHVLRSKGMKPMTGLRPVDSPEQFREMSVALKLVAYVDAEVTVDAMSASATIFVRNGTTGLRTASATFAGERRLLGATIAKELWERIAPALRDAVADAAKPHAGVREPMRVNAGSPLTNQEAAEATD
jgi:hypothetical protein